MIDIAKFLMFAGVIAGVFIANRLGYPRWALPIGGLLGGIPFALVWGVLWWRGWDSAGKRMDR